MALPAFNAEGDLPAGLHAATLDEVVARFESGSQREKVTRTLLEIHRLARSTGKLDRFVIYGSYVTAKEEPNDVDVALIMMDDFESKSCDSQTRVLFDHEQAESKLHASVFWSRPSYLLRETADEWLLGWQRKRDKSRRGIVEVIQ